MQLSVRTARRQNRSGSSSSAIVPRLRRPVVKDPRIVRFLVLPRPARDTQHLAISALDIAPNFLLATRGHRPTSGESPRRSITQRSEYLRTEQNCLTQVQHRRRNNRRDSQRPSGEPQGVRAGHVASGSLPFTPNFFDLHSCSVTPTVPGLPHYAAQRQEPRASR